MLTFATFNSMLKSFLDELAPQFPRDADVAMMQNGLGAVAFCDEQAPARMFVDALAPYAPMVEDRNPALFAELRVGSIDLAALWRATRDADTRETIFEHVAALLTLGTHLFEIHSQ